MALDLGRMLQGQVETLGLIGACLSRDLKLSAFGDADAKYIWRVNTISLMSAAPERLELNLPDDMGHDSRLTLEADVNKTFNLEAILNEKIVLLDFFRDVYGVIELEDGRFITNGLEIQQFGLSLLKASSKRQIEVYEDEYIDLWLQSVRAFAEMANRAGCRILIFPIRQLMTMQVDGAIVLRSDWDLKQIAMRDIVLGHMQRIALALLKNAVIAPVRTEYLALDPHHEYGAGPFHFKRELFDLCVQDMRLAPERLRRPNYSHERIEAIVAHEVALWRKFNASYEYEDPVAEPTLKPSEMPVWGAAHTDGALAHS